MAQHVRAFKTQWDRGTCVGRLSNRSYIVDIDDQLVRRNHRFLKPSVNKPSCSEEVLEENTKEVEGPVAQATAAGELQQDESAAEEERDEQPTLETEPNTHQDPAQKLVQGEIGPSQYKTRSGRISRPPIWFQDFVNWNILVYSVDL